MRSILANILLGLQILVLVGVIAALLVLVHGSFFPGL